MSRQLGFLIGVLFLCASELASARLSAPGPSVVGLTASGLCSGVQISPHFILTASHCVNLPGNPVTVTGPTGNFAGQTASRDTGRLLALVCSVPNGATPVSLATAIPGSGAAVIIESRTPGPPADWRSATTVVSSTASTITVNAVPGYSLPCNGDSGSPSYHGGNVAGILESVAVCGGPGIYTAVGPHRSWILSEIKKHNDACAKWVKFQINPTP